MKLTLNEIYIFVPNSYSTIHKAASLTVPGRSMILPGTIPETSISREWSQWLERPLGVVPTGKNAYRQLCESIHKAASWWQERPQRPFPYSRLQGFSGIVPGKAGNGSAGGFVNSAVNHHCSQIKSHKFFLCYKSKVLTRLAINNLSVVVNH